MAGLNRESRSSAAAATSNAEAWAAAVAAASDLTLVIDRAGVIRDVTNALPDVAEVPFDQYVGRPWAETVTVESRPKVAAILRDAAEQAARRWRHINVPTHQGADLPLLCSAVQVGQDGRFVAFARDLRPISDMQRKMIDAQQSMERDYRRLRYAENRFETLFRQLREAVLLVQADTLAVVEANPAAARLLQLKTSELNGKLLPDLFSASDSHALLTAIGSTRSSGRTMRQTVSRAGAPATAERLQISVSAFRQEAGATLLVRLEPETSATETRIDTSELPPVVEFMPDAFAVTDAEGRIAATNPAFLDLVQFASAEQVRGESLARWLGRGAVDLNVMLANLKQHGTIRLFATSFVGEYGSASEVEICAAEVREGDLVQIAFSIRDVGRRLSAVTRIEQALPRNVGQLTELVGRVPMKDIVSQTTDLIEQLCIEAALGLTNDNKASAAEMLGVSRQNLYIKLRRFGLNAGADDTPGT